jgi:hypothetical protein
MAPKRGGHYCSVVSCYNNQRKHGPRGVKFFRFPKNQEQKALWLKAIRRVNVDKTTWSPGNGKFVDISILLKTNFEFYFAFFTHRRVCSKHFVDGKKSKDADSPSFVPTILPQKVTKIDVKRTERRKHREKLQQDVQLTTVPTPKVKFEEPESFDCGASTSIDTQGFNIDASCQTITCKVRSIGTNLVQVRSRDHSHFWASRITNCNQ